MSFITGPPYRAAVNSCGWRWKQRARNTSASHAESTFPLFSSRATPRQFP